MMIQNNDIHDSHDSDAAVEALLADAGVIRDSGAVASEPEDTHAKRGNIVETIAKIISYLGSPLLMPTYGMIVVMWLSIMTYLLTPQVKWILAAITLSVTCLLPMIAIFILWRCKVIKNPALNEGRDRTVPYALCILFYVAMGLYLNRLHAADWMSSFMYGGAMAIAIDLAVNLRWKISGHATAQGGLIALIFYLLYHNLATEAGMAMIVTAIFLAGLVCTTRLILQRHTLCQLGAGFACGFVCVFVAATYF